MVEAENQYALTSMFVRIQEFYESPFDNIRGKYFSLEEYMDTYAKENKNFTYFSDWSGFNIPGWSFKMFYDLFKYDLRDKEVILRQGIQGLHLRNPEAKFYVIGSIKGQKRVVNHELAHAYWYIYPDYQKKMNNMIQQLNSELRISAESSLIEQGYHKEMIVDEMQAYLSTTKNRSDLLRYFGWDSFKKVKIPSSFKKFFKEFELSHK